MRNQTPRSGRSMRSISLVAAGLVAAAVLAIPLSATALPLLIDPHTYYTGGDVTIDVISHDSVYEDVLQIWSPLGRFDVIDGSQVGAKTTLTMAQLADMGIHVGDELKFTLHVRNTDDHFFLGSDNADGLIHAYVRPTPGAYYVGFEDLMGGGDRDYNDTILRFSGGMSGARPQEVAYATQVAEPSMLLLLLPGIGLLGLKRQRKSTSPRTN